MFPVLAGKYFGLLFLLNVDIANTADFIVLNRENQQVLVSPSIGKQCVATAKRSGCSTIGMNEMILPKSIASIIVIILLPV